MGTLSPVRCPLLLLLLLLLLCESILLCDDLTSIAAGRVPRADVASVLVIDQRACQCRDIHCLNLSLSQL
jgi:hypothetical protein